MQACSFNWFWPIWETNSQICWIFFPVQPTMPSSYSVDQPACTTHSSPLIPKQILLLIAHWLDLEWDAQAHKDRVSKLSKVQFSTLWIKNKPDQLSALSSSIYSWDISVKKIINLSKLSIESIILDIIHENINYLSAQLLNRLKLTGSSSSVHKCWCFK